MPLADIIEQQQNWARAKWPAHSARRAPSLEANLMCEMRPEFRAQFTSGNGSELGRKGKPGKMQSLRSSSALAFNVFAPWHLRDQSLLALALGHSITDRTVRFEKKFQHGLSSAPPNLDVVLDEFQPRPLAIESKFTEPYGKKEAYPPLDPKYLHSHRRRWSELGMPRCQQLANDLGKQVRYSRLDAGQLLKHLLGLAYSTKERPRLLCLWFDSGCSEADQHREELAEFEAAVSGDVEFSSRTYQEVISALSLGPDPVPGYREYLRARYAPA